MPLRKDGIETKKKILAVCVRLFLEQGYRETTISQIVEEAGVARGSFQNLFPTKDAVLMELVKPMFGGQFGVARGLVGDSLPPVYAYAAETAIQLTLTGAEREPAGNISGGLHPAGHGGVYLSAHHGGAEADLRGEFPEVFRQRLLRNGHRLGGTHAQLYGQKVRHPFSLGAQAQALSHGGHADV